MESWYFDKSENRIRRTRFLTIVFLTLIFLYIYTLIYVNQSNTIVANSQLYRLILWTLNEINAQGGG